MDWSLISDLLLNFNLVLVYLSLKVTTMVHAQYHCFLYHQCFTKVHRCVLILDLCAVILGLSLTSWVPAPICWAPKPVRCFLRIPVPQRVYKPPFPGSYVHGALSTASHLSSSLETLYVCWVKAFYQNIFMHKLRLGISWPFHPHPWEGFDALAVLLEPLVSQEHIV